MKALKGIRDIDDGGVVMSHHTPHGSLCYEMHKTTATVLS
jgi:hypothetical protein